MSEARSESKRSGAETPLSRCVAAGFKRGGERVVRVYLTNDANREEEEVMVVDRNVDYREWSAAVRRAVPSFSVFEVQEKFYYGTHSEKWVETRFDSATKKKRVVSEKERVYRKRDTKVDVLDGYFIESYVAEDTEFPNFDNIRYTKSSIMRYRYPRNALVGIDICFVRHDGFHTCYLEAHCNQYNHAKLSSILSSALQRFFQRT